MVVSGSKPLDGAIDLVTSAFKVIDLLDNLLRSQLLLDIRRLGCALAADQGDNFGQGESELLSLKDHLHAHSISGAIEARIAFPAGLDEAATLVKPQGAEADATQLRHLADRQFRMSYFRFSVPALPAVSE
jgi:hypothetical protein